MGGSRAVLVLLAAVAACGPPRRDVAHADLCRSEPAEPRLSTDAALEAPNVVLARVRYTGSVELARSAPGRTLSYVIVDVLEHLRGDPWAVAPRFRRSFPLLADADGDAPEAVALRSLSCQKDRAFVFFVDLPKLGAPLERATPEPVEDAFGPGRVRLIGVRAETARDAVLSGRR